VIELAYEWLLFKQFRSPLKNALKAQRLSLTAIGSSKPGALRPVSPAAIGALRAPVFCGLWRKNPSHPLRGWSLTQNTRKSRPDAAPTHYFWDGF
jgi:hypothetical protein